MLDESKVELTDEEVKALLSKLKPEQLRLVHDDSGDRLEKERRENLHLCAGEVKQLIAEWGFSIGDVLQEMFPTVEALEKEFPCVKASRPRSRKATGGPPPKCQDPETGEIWDGRGSAPTWLVNRAIDAEAVNERGDWDHDAWLTWGMEKYPMPKKHHLVEDTA